MQNLWGIKSGYYLQICFNKFFRLGTKIMFYIKHVHCILEENKHIIVIRI
jgi:hypothetical protein